jgi:hypothetical protein
LSKAHPILVHALDFPALPRTFIQVVRPVIGTSEVISAKHMPMAGNPAIGIEGIPVRSARRALFGIN